MRPLIAITTDVSDGKYSQGVDYARAVAEAGGIPIILPHLSERIDEYVETMHGFILSGGDDPIMEEWGVATHPKAKKIDPARQQFELALLRALNSPDHHDRPVLGICLGMQLMALEAGGALDQHLPESNPAAAARHWGRKPHGVSGELGQGTVLSHHRQAVTDPGRLRAWAHADDGMIEAVIDDARPFYIGVQWHPERTADPALGLALFRQLIGAARGRELAVQSGGDRDRKGS